MLSTTMDAYNHARSVIFLTITTVHVYNVNPMRYADPILLIINKTSVMHVHMLI